MKSNLIKSAVAAALTLAAGNALALTPAELQTAINNGTLQVIHISGATATDGVLQNLAINNVGLFQPGSAHVYSITAPSSFALTGRAAFSGNGIAAGTPIAIVKEAAGGSANGIRQVADSLPLNFLNVLNIPANQGSFALNGAGTTYVGPSGATVPALVTSQVPYGGISDIDPGSFVGTAGVTVGHAGALAARGSIAVTFNPVVSLPLYRALQEAQGIIAPGAAEDTSSVDKLPSISSALVAGIINGTLQVAEDVWVDGKVRLSDVHGGDDSLLYVCRRGNTSGTQATFALHFLNQGVSGSASATNSFVGPDSSDVTSGSPWNAGAYGFDLVYAGSGSGDVRNCLAYRSAQGQLAIGIASTENRPSAINYRYVKVDGAAPTLQEVIAGNYPVFSQNTFNHRLSANTNSATHRIWNQIHSLIGTPSVLASVNSSFQNAVAITAAGAETDGRADTGILAIPTASSKPDFPVSGPSVRSKPVNGQLRQNVQGAAYSGNRPYLSTP